MAFNLTNTIRSACQLLDINVKKDHRNVEQVIKQLKLVSISTDFPGRIMQNHDRRCRNILDRNTCASQDNSFEVFWLGVTGRRCKRNSCSETYLLKIGETAGKKSLWCTFMCRYTHLRGTKRRFCCNSEFHGFNRSSDSNLTTIFRRYD